MGSIGSQDLSLDYSSTRCVPQSIHDKSSRVETESDMFQKLDEYVNRLQDELRKIDAFKRELPLCMFLLNNAILTAKEELMKCKRSKPEPVLKEFMPLKESCDDYLNYSFASSLASPKLDNIKKRNEAVISNWQLIDDSLQIGNTGTMEKKLTPHKGCDNKVPSMETKGKLEDSDDSSSPVPVLTLCLPEIKNSKKASFSTNYDSNITSVTNGQQKPVRKQRRCWSQELHRRFVDALDQLGGHKVATPKQIRELMQVNGLTNDEVKSHLQKYRLHHRRVSSTRNTLTPRHKTSLCSEPLKNRIFKSNSPQGPLQFPGVEVVEDDDDGMSEYDMLDKP